MTVVRHLTGENRLITRAVFWSTVKKFGAIGCEILVQPDSWQLARPGQLTRQNRKPNDPGCAITVVTVAAARDHPVHLH